MRNFALTAAAALLAFPPRAADAQRAPQTAAGQRVTPAALPALDRAHLDTTCAPCQNFYQFATGGWRARTPIPDAFPAWSSFDEMSQRNAERLRRILAQAARSARTPARSDRDRLGHFYAACMDSTSIERIGRAPLQPMLRAIDAITTRAALGRQIAILHAAGVPVGFTEGAAQDDRNSARVILRLAQGGLGLPEREYYTNTDSASHRLRQTYRAHMAAILRLTGVDSLVAERQADDVLRLETTLASRSLNRLERRDPAAQYHWISRADLSARAPAIDWPMYLRTLGLMTVDSVNLAHPEFFALLSTLVRDEPLGVWRAYLRVHVAQFFAPWLHEAFAKQQFAFTSALTGAREMQPRWRRCGALADRFLTDALGEAYVHEAFAPAAREAMDRMVDNILAVYRVRLERLEWMSPDTRAEALRKLGSVKRKLGYPSQWRSYAALDIERQRWFTSVQRALVFETRADLRDVGRPVDRDRWLMSPPTVNAYYSAANNEIVFPAGRTQAPFFDAAYDAGANYGGIGVTIGHEISHGFDDQGRQYDASGNRRDWWQPEDAARFTELAGRMAAQYEAYTVLDSLHLNGRQTLGENIADNAGIAIAYAALQRALGDGPRTLIDGFTPEQRFFLAWAQARRQHWRDASLRLAVRTGVHAPGEFRVNGPLSNFAPFAAAFGCRTGDAMVRKPADQVIIW